MTSIHRLRTSSFCALAAVPLALSALAHAVTAFAEFDAKKSAPAPVVISVADAAKQPLLTAQPFVFVTRHQYTRGHHNTETFYPSIKSEFKTGKFTPGGALKIIDFKTGKETTLLETATGIIRDPEVHFDGKRILFSMQKNAADSYHIYEINTDGSGLKQLTFVKDADDIDPFYLADDHIGFSSTREPKYCGCNRHIMANLYRMEPDGANIHQISKNTLFDGHGVLLPDGRILYDRWEYVDRNYGDAQGLWVCNPDGTNHAIYWGNNTPSPAGAIDARPIPGTDKVIAILAATHERPWGALAIIDRKIGLEGPKPIVKIWPESAIKHVWESAPAPHFGIDDIRAVTQKFEDPYPLDEKHFICARQITAGVNDSWGGVSKTDKTGLFLVDTAGNETLLYSDEKYGCFDPMPVAPRIRPPVLPMRRDYSSKTGTFYVLDVYNGTHMEGVKRGDAKYLRVVEVPEKRFWSKGRAWKAQGTVYPAISWDDFNTKKILGTVPVNEDGSAYFEVPAEKFVYFQLLDKDGVMIQSMRSGTMVQPGEQNGCVGCHDDRLATVPAKSNIGAIFKRRPDKLQLRNGVESKEFSYREEVQPVFDKHCVSCHNPEKSAGKKLNLSGGAAQVFNPSYAELWAKKYIAPVGAGPARILPARSWGSSRSKLVTVLSKKHGNALLNKEELEKIVTWIDLNAPYYPSYATSYPDNPYGRSPLSELETRQLAKLTGVQIAPGNHDRGGELTSDAARAANGYREAVMLRLASNLNFDEPEKSPVLAGLKAKSPEKYAEAVKILEEGKKRIAANGSNDLSGFKYCPTDAWREERYQAFRRREEANRASIRNGQKHYDEEKP